MHLALVKIGVPWRTALDMSESEAGGYLDAYAEMNGVRQKRAGNDDSSGGQKHYRATRRLPKKRQ